MTYPLPRAYSVFCGKFIITVNNKKNKVNSPMFVCNDSRLSLKHQYNAFNVYCRELAPGTVSLTGYRAQGDDSKHCAYCSSVFTWK